MSTIAEIAEEMGYKINLERDSQFFKMENYFRDRLTPKPEMISKETDPLPRLQFIPEYIAELIRKKKQLKKRCEANMHQDSKYLRRYNNVRQEIRTRIRRHAAVLKHFDMLTESEQTGDKNHFSTSLDVARVQSLIIFFRLHEHEPFYMALMMHTKQFTKDLYTGRVLRDKSENMHFYYYWYAIYSAYGDFVLAHPYYHEIFHYHLLEKMLQNVEQKLQQRPKGTSWSQLVQKYYLRKNPPQ